MAGQVRVEDLEVFGRFRVALVKFAQAADQAMGSADGQMSRTHSWLEGEQMAHWQGEARRRAELVTKAREAVRQKTLYKDFAGKQRQAIEEQKYLDKCVRDLAEAQAKIELVRKWLPRLEKAGDMYRSGVSRLSKTVVDDVPRGVALLDRLAASLEAYMQVAGPGGGGGGGDVPATAFDESMSRGREAEVGASYGEVRRADGAVTEEAPAAAPADVSDVKKEQEGGHGVGQ